jgi:hypothetical protein
VKKWFSIAVLLSLLTAAASSGEESGWKWPNLNPFSNSTTTGGPPTSGWKMPKLLPQASAPKRRTKKQPSTLSKMTSGTKNFFSKTADALNPWDDKPQEQPKITGSNSIFSQQKKAAREEDKGSGILPASWWSADKDARPKSVNDFLAQPRP